jgi:hypothetical protein
LNDADFKLVDLVENFNEVHMAIWPNTNRPSIKAGELPAPPLEFPLTVGAIGRLRGSTFKLLQRLGDKEARIGIHRSMDLDELRAYARDRFTTLPEVDVFLSNYDVSRMADEQEHKTTECFIVTKTKTYETAVGGTRTIFVIEPFDSSAAQAIFTKAMSEERAAERRIDVERDLRREQRAKDAERAKMERNRQAEMKRYPALLKNARALIKDRLYDAADKMLHRIIKEAPGTDAAKEAQKELDAMPHH